MSFTLKKFIEGVFAPQEGDVITMMSDLPHGVLKDTDAWRERRRMAEEWHTGLSKETSVWGAKVLALVTYPATGSNGAELPAMLTQGGKAVTLEDVMRGSTIIISMPQFSATAPLWTQAEKFNKKLRIGSMPGCGKFMEDTGLSADYIQIAKRCEAIAPHLEKADGVEVEFSTGHKCYFDLSNHNAVHKDDGNLRPDPNAKEPLLCNLPAGEVYTVPNENPASLTAGELPEIIGGKVVVYTVKANRITGVTGEGEGVKKQQDYFDRDPARRNIAECAIGCNDRATVTGSVLQDEKAGFHWAYGRSDHLGGATGIKDFKAPENVVHNDIIYSKFSPIICKKFDAVFPDGSRKTLIIDGELKV